MNKKYKYLIIVFLIVASFIAFGRILGNDFVNYDDNAFITENNHIKAGFNTESIKWAFTAASSPDFWHPLTWLSIMLDWSLFGANAGGHHLVSLLWHIGGAILLFLFLSKTTGSLWPSAFVAALFALHPLRVESVAWAAERKDVLSVFFGLAALYAYALYIEKHQVSKYIICITLFILSLMSKPTFVTLPFMLLLLDYWPLGRWQKALNPVNMQVSNNTLLVKKKGKRRKAGSTLEKKISTPIKRRGHLIGGLLWEKVPFIILSVAVTIMITWQLKDAGLLKPLQHLPFFQRVMNAIVSYVSYLGKTFWPVDLAVFYPYQYNLPLWQFLGSLLILLLISAVVISYIRKLPFLFVGWCWYLGTLIPVIGLIQGGDQSMADRYTYLPSIGIAIMLVWGVFYLLPKVKLREIIIIPAAIILAALAFLTWRQCGYWKNSIELFNHALQVTKNNGLAHGNLGSALAGEGKNEEAIAHYLAAIEINPNYGYAHAYLGVALAAQGKNEEAIAHYLAAIKINPQNYKAHYNFAHTLRAQGNIEAAMNQLQKTLLINAKFADAHADIGIICAMYLNKNDEAIYHFRQALQIERNNARFHFNLGLALTKKGEINEAIEHFREAIYLKPDFEDARRALRQALDIERKLKN